MTPDLTSSNSHAAWLLGVLCLAPAAAAQDPADLTERVRRLEQRNAELERKLDGVTQEIERSQIGEVVTPLGTGRHGLGPGASKIYERASGLSIGGYGEMLFSQISGRTDQFDALRAVLYAGYKFDEHWLVNTEIEIEHGTTEASSGTTASEGSVSLEFGYVDHLVSDAFNLRGGLVLVPSGLVNELHEPTTFLPAARSQTETRIIPTTWRELGVGAFGEVGGFAYRAYLLTSLDGEEFTASGLRPGRQKGNRVAADDFSLAGRLDWVETKGLTLGGSVVVGNTGQDNLRGTTAIPDLRTTILDAHLDWRGGPWQLRALYATALVDDAGEFNAATGQRVAERSAGWYAEVGFDVFAGLTEVRGQSLQPFVRYESIDTQEHMPPGFAASGAQEDRILTFGITYKPLDQLVLKVDFEDWSEDPDVFHVLLGYVF